MYALRTGCVGSRWAGLAVASLPGKLSKTSKTLAFPGCATIPSLRTAVALLLYSPHMSFSWCRLRFLVAFVALLASLVRAFGEQPAAAPRRPAPATAAQPVIIDTDIGDDIDDAFALAIALSSPELRIVGITSDWGNTPLRAQLIQKLLYVTGRQDIPVAVGVQTSSAVFSQSRWSRAFRPAHRPLPSAVDFLRQQLDRHPGQITLICIGPFRNIGALIDRYPASFRKAKRVVLMGGSIHYSYSDLGFLPPTGPVPEYNVYMDVPDARKLFSAGVPIEMMGLDATTRLKLDEVKRQLLFTRQTPLTNALTLLYHLWGHTTPTLFDPMAVVEAMHPELCPVQPFHVSIDAKGTTLVTPGAPNVRACLHPKVDGFFRLYMNRVLTQELRPAAQSGVPGKSR